MNTPNNEKSICVAFNEEVLLYLNDELSSKQIQLYKDHLMICTKCSSNLKYNIGLIELAKNNIEEEISDYKLELMIKNAISKKENSSTKYFPFHNLFDFLLKTTFRKVAFSGIAVIILLFFLLPSTNVLIKSDTAIDSTGFNKTHISIENYSINAKIDFEDDEEWRKNILPIGEAINRNIKTNQQNNF